jgi:hypothetical protein
MYTQGVDYKGFIRSTIKIFMYNQKSTFFCQNFEMKQFEEDEGLIERLWIEVVSLNGMGLTRIDCKYLGGYGHQMFLKAGYNQKKEKVFFIGDPLYVDYKEIDFKNILKYFRNFSVNFN